MTDSGKGFIRHRRLLSKCSVNSSIELSLMSLHRSDSYSKNPSYSYSYRKAVLLNRVVVGSEREGRIRAAQGGCLGE